MNKTLTTILATLLMTISAVEAAEHQAVPAVSTQVAAGSSLTDGEVRKVDMETKKLTLKHGEIKNLGMPGMTMVFQVKDSSMLEKVKTGDKVRFTVEKIQGTYTITSLEAAN
jgi:Cu(I)/Ag(I) efflux system periplasmic protein CusF